MNMLHAFFIQYRVTQRHHTLSAGPRRQGLATVIVFADENQTAAARAGRIVAGNQLEINEIVRVSRITDRHIPMLDSVLRSLYGQAERFGIGIHCDFWPAESDCCWPKRKPY